MPQDNNDRAWCMLLPKRSTISSRWSKLLLLGCLALFVFALYAPAVRLMLIHDDAANITWMNGYNLLTIFALSQTGSTGASARPIVNVLWIAVRELFGWYYPPLIHYYNVFFHVLNTMMVAVLAMRLCHLGRSKAVVYGLLAGLIFGLFPFSYQAVLWAGALYHPVLAFGGLLTVHAYLTAQSRGGFWRWMLVVCGLAIAMLSHEAGFVFGFVIVGMELVLAGSERRRLHWPALLVGAIAFLYIGAYRLIMPGLWVVPGASSAEALVTRVANNAAYFMQSFVNWLLIMLRSVIGLTQNSAMVVMVLFTVSLVIAGIWLRRMHRLILGAIALMMWCFTLVPALFLTEDYVRFSPRLLYASSIGVALFWGLVLTLVLQAARSRYIKMMVLAGCAVLFAWCVPYIGDRMNETARLTPAMRAIDADMRVTDQSARVLLINMPYWNAPGYPAFLLGVEGMPIFQSADIPAWTWLATVNGTRRDMTYVRHDISLTHGELFNYGIPGHKVDDTALRHEILQNNLIYRFDYDEPGLRSVRLANIRSGFITPVMTFNQAGGRASIQSARALYCESAIQLTVEWGNVGGIQQPVAVFVHGLSPDGQQTIVADRDLVDGYLPLDQVPFGYIVDETRIIKKPAGVVSELRLGVYNRVSGERFTAIDAASVQLPEGEYTIPVVEGGDDCR